MPVTPTYPGVYIEEVPSGVRTISGVATSITAFVGRALRGPLNDPITINNYGDYERIFGGLWLESTMSYAVSDFFQNGGGQAIIVRLFNEADIPAVENKAYTAAAAVAAELDETGSDKGTLLDKAEVAKDSFTDTIEKTAATIVYDAILVAHDADGGNITTMRSAAATAIDTAAPDGEFLVAAVDNLGKSLLTIGSGNKVLNLEAAYEGSWGNHLRVRIDHDVSQEFADRYDGIVTADLFNLTVTDMKTGVTEQFRNLTVIESPRQIKKVLENESDLIRAESVGTNIPDEHSEPDTGKTIWQDKDASEGVANNGMASDGARLNASDFTTNKKLNKKGLYALDDADLFNLLCIPPHEPSVDIEPALITAAAVYCEERRSIFLVDAPSGWTNKEDAKNSIGGVGTTSKNAAIFFPRLRKPNPKRDNQMEDFAPCGAVAGVIARTDAQRGIWKSPAGLDAGLVGVPKMSVPLTDAENGELNPLGINCLRAMPAAGRVIWGARTLQGNDRLSSEWKYLSVRRLALYIEESLYRGTHWVVFEPNDEPLWSQIRLNLGAFMHNLFRQGAFQGSSPKEAYFVKCNKETTTQNDINQGVVNILIGFAPLKPAEFVIIKLQQIAGQVAA
ncbi:MAG: phage tail sheath family protein [Candidatus Marinimicrobia bacterium]|nr:phage tail sheath family protein [Candidatus Neomarinimicrobiota bacterium]